MQPAPPGSSSHGWWQIPLSGGSLGLLQILIVVSALVLPQEVINLNQWPSGVLADKWLPIALSALFYALIPALAGFLDARQSGAASSGVGAGCLVGGFGLLVIVIAAVALVGIAAAAPPPQPATCPEPGTCGHGIAPYFSPGSIAFIFVIPVLIFEGLCGVVGGLVGGWIGGERGRRWATASGQRSTAAEEHAPQEADD
jgi:hypothetical protein